MCEGGVQINFILLQRVCKSQLPLWDVHGKSIIKYNDVIPEKHLIGGVVKPGVCHSHNAVDFVGV